MQADRIMIYRKIPVFREPQCLGKQEVGVVRIFNFMKYVTFSAELQN